MPDPVAFMVMPFDRKPTWRTEPAIPSTIDFDRLWLHVYQPVLADLGYRAVRADADLGSLIIQDMLRRLVLGDIVVADITLANANVYYEVGVRHAARMHGCLLVAADWATPVFDLGQIRQARFPLADGEIGDDAAVAARARLATVLAPLRGTVSPVFQSLPGYPRPDQRLADTAFDIVADDLMAFDVDVRAVGLAPAGQRAALAQQVVARHGNKPAVRQADAMLLLRLLRDNVGWDAVLDYVERLPDYLAKHPGVIEQQCLALANSGRPGAAAQAAATLEALIERYGETSERLGLLGGRYKRLSRDASERTEQDRLLDKAIDSYERGMLADLNDYYPASNLAPLYVQRRRPGDDARAAEADSVAAAACRRAIAQGSGDEWVRPTLLGLAFRRGDVEHARSLAEDVAREGSATWKLDTTMADLLSIPRRVPEHEQALTAVLDDLRRLIARPPVRVETAAQIPAALARLGLPGHRRVLVVVGGAGGMEPEQLAAASALVGEHLIPAVQRWGAAIVDGGTDSGVMSALGRAHDAAGARTPLVGVAAEGTVILAGPPADGDHGADDHRAPVEPHHTDLVLVPGTEWGQETPWIPQVAAAIAAGAPSATLVVNGGEITYGDVEASLRGGRPVVVLAGSGRTADAIAAARQGRDAGERAQRIAQDQRVHVVELTDSAGLVAVLDSLLIGQPA